ncbi:hypothetical protein MMYC01_207828 [Madurella mycetomatis]|uniref:Uncharacterized protein n=1 Tax=Madurella mycetomatis TaxID=100816 RepID=A0A175VUG4_9PEZI|nr:hypothetical protein MMYC01_207828 [Madurella mycetomatis]
MPSSAGIPVNLSHPTGFTKEEVVEYIESYLKKTKHITAMLQLPLLRDIEMNLDQHNHSRVLNWDRPTNREAALMQVTGWDPDISECVSCQGNTGPFLNCIVSDICGNGSCANCHYNSEGKRCSFRQAEEDAGIEPRRMKSQGRVSTQGRQRLNNTGATPVDTGKRGPASTATASSSVTNTGSRQRAPVVSRRSGVRAALTEKRAIAKYLRECLQEVEDEIET